MTTINLTEKEAKLLLKLLDNLLAGSHEEITLRDVVRRQLLYYNNEAPIKI